MAIQHAEHPPRASGNRDSSSHRERPNETGRLSAATEFREKVRHILENAHGVVVMYDRIELAVQRIDMIVDEKLVVETKSTIELHAGAQRQVYSYLRATTL